MRYQPSNILATPFSQAEDLPLVLISGCAVHLQAAAQRYLDFNLGIYADPCFLGDYPASVRKAVKALPHFTEEQKKQLKASVDYFALNHYTTVWVEHSKHNLQRAWLLLSPRLALSCKPTANMDAQTGTSMQEGKQVAALKLQLPCNLGCFLFAWMSCRGGWLKQGLVGASGHLASHHHHSSVLQQLHCLSAS